jgi:hypothetical protein
VPTLPFRKKKEQPEIRKPHMTDDQDGYAFRRSRTITGTITENVKTTETHDSHLKTPRTRLHELHVTRKKLLSRLTVTLIFLGIFAYLLYEYTGMTSRVTFAESVLIEPDTSQYVSTIHEYYADNPLEQFRFSVDDERLSRYVQDTHPEVSDVVVGRDENGLGYIFTLRKPLLSWTTSGGQFFIDTTGSSFTDNYFGVPTLTVDDKSGISDEAGGTIVSSRFIRFVGLVIGNFNEKSSESIEQVVLPANTTHEVDFKLKGHEFSVKTNIDRDPARQAADMVNAINYMKEKGITPLYVDVRVEGKAFYRDK